MFSSSSALAASNATTMIGVGFGTAALGGACYDVVTMALQVGFRKFDTAEEADWWYDQKAVGRALQDFLVRPQQCGRTCEMENLLVSTKIPPWSLTSEENIRSNAIASREQLLGFCNDPILLETTGTAYKTDTETNVPFPLDVYYIHAPTCWKGWHSRCDDHPPLLDLRSAWLAMEAVVGLDHTARRIGLSNIRPDELLDIVRFVRSRQQNAESSSKGSAPPRIPDVVQAYADPIKPAEELRLICRENDIEFVSYSTLGTQHRSVHENPVLGSPIVKRLAQKHTRSTAEVVLSWALQRGMSVIPRSSKQLHIDELARLLQEEPTFLDQSDLAEIDSMKYTL
jgi:diketogulonate reductase-like aldo/keto reductase